MRVKGLKAVILEGGGGKVCGLWTVWGREREQNGRMGRMGMKVNGRFGRCFTQLVCMILLVIL